MLNTKMKQLAPPPTPIQAAVDRGNLEFAQWLINEGADINHVTKKLKSYALEWAVSWGKEDVVRWMFAHGARVQEQKSGRSLLAVALNAETLQEAKSEALIQLLLNAGADPYMEHNKKKAAVDILAKRHDIRRLRELDKKRVYRQLVNQYTPPENSPFVGVWWNEQGEFKTFSLILNDEGLAIVGTSIMPLGFFPWRTTESNRAVIELTMDQKRQDLVVEYSQDTKTLRIVAPSEMTSDPLKKQAEKPLKADEYLKHLKNGGEKGDGGE